MRPVPSLLRFLSLILVLLIAGCSADQTPAESPPAAEEASAPTETVTQTPADLVMRVAVDPSNPPFEYRGDDGALTGFNVSLMEMVAEQAGLEFEWVELDYGDFQTALKDNTADVSIAGRFPPIMLSDQPIVGQEILDQLPESIGLSDAFFVMDERVYIRNPRAAPTDVGYVRGHMAIYAEEGQEPDWSLSGFDTFEEAFAAMEDGTLDAVYAPRIHAENASPAVGVLYTNSVVAYRPYWMAVREDSGRVEAINTALTAVIDSGEYADLYRQYFAPPVPSAYLSLEQRDPATYETAEELLAVGNDLAVGVRDCLAASEYASCFRELGETTLQRTEELQAKVEQLPTASESPPLDLVQQLLGATEALASECTQFRLTDLSGFSSKTSEFLRLSELVMGTFYR